MPIVIVCCHIWYIFMKHLIVKNVGPVKEVDIELKRFNVIIGPQGSGKSTVAKILSTCEWIEKEVATTRDENVVGSKGDFRKMVEGFHKIEGYIDGAKPSYLFFETDFVLIEYGEAGFRVELKRSAEYHRQKICYIPSERNMIALSELNGFEFKTTNLRSFLFDWYRAREFYSPVNKVDILGLGVKYYYDKDLKSGNDRLQHINGETYDISLGNSSSGLQSVAPLIVMLQYYTGQYFTEYDFKNSFEQEAKLRKMRSALTREVALEKYKPGYRPEEAPDLIKEFNDKLHRNDTVASQIFAAYDEACNRLMVPNRTTFIVEEPEQNLYPFTQVALLDSLMTLCNSQREHGFTITTHSPFLLNYLNVLVMRHYKGVEGKASVDPENLAVYAMQDGRMVDMMQVNEATGLWSVNAEDLIEAMREMYGEYVELKRL